MALSLAQLRAKIQTSIHGRRMGLDNDDCVSGPKGMRQTVTAATSASTGTQLPNYGIITLTSTETGGTGWQIDNLIDHRQGLIVVNVTLVSRHMGIHLDPELNSGFKRGGSREVGSVQAQAG